MMKDRFEIFWSWTPRTETPQQIHNRVTNCVATAAKINSAFKDWQVVDFADRLQGLFGRAGKQAFGPSMGRAPSEPAPPKGFMLLAAKDPNAWPDRMGMLCVGGGRMTFPGMCGTTFKTEAAERPDPTIASYQSFKSILLSLAPLWDTTYAEAYTSELRRQLKRGSSSLGPSWMTYLAPELAKEISPPPNIGIEHLPDGGILLIATEDVFDAGNPAHLAAAQSIGDALASLAQKLGLPGASRGR